MSRSTAAIIQDTIDLLQALDASITGFDAGRVTWADTIPERALASLARFPQSGLDIDPDGVKRPISFHDRLTSAWADEIDACMDEMAANISLSDELKAIFFRVSFYVRLMNGLRESKDGTTPAIEMTARLRELRNMLVVTSLQTKDVGGSVRSLPLESDLAAELDPLPAGCLDNAPPDRKPRRPTLNVYMVELLQKHGQECCLSWSIEEWAINLQPQWGSKPSRSTIHGTATWELLQGLRREAGSALRDKQSEKDESGKRRSTAF